MAQPAEISVETRDAATLLGAMPDHGLVLVGTFLKQGGPEALVREPLGKIRSVALGDTICGYTVVAIEDGALYIAQLSRVRKLTVPGLDGHYAATHSLAP